MHVGDAFVLVLHQGQGQDVLWVHHQLDICLRETWINPLWLTIGSKKCNPTHSLHKGEEVIAEGSELVDSVELHDAFEGLEGLLCGREKGQSVAEDELDVLITRESQPYIVNRCVGRGATGIQLDQVQRGTKVQSDPYNVHQNASVGVKTVAQFHMSLTLSCCRLKVHVHMHRQMTQTWTVFNVETNILCTNVKFCKYII